MITNGSSLKQKILPKGNDNKPCLYATRPTPLLHATQSLNHIRIARHKPPLRVARRKTYLCTIKELNIFVY
jgi:hypothetical protein